MKISQKLKKVKDISTDTNVTSVTQDYIFNEPNRTSDYDSKAQKPTQPSQPKEKKKVNSKSIPKQLTLFGDTEFNQRKDVGMSTTGIPVYCPELDTIRCCPKDELSDDFNIISWLLEKEGYKVGKVNRVELEEKLNKLWKKKGYKNFTTANQKKFLQEHLVQSTFEKMGVNIDDCDLDFSKKKKKIVCNFKKVDCTMQFFFAYADLFRIFGKDCQVIWQERAKLTQFRTIKIMGIVKVSLMVDGIPTDFNISIFDNRYCFPPRAGSLDGQAKTFDVAEYLKKLESETSNQTIKELIANSTSKIKVSEQIKEKYGDEVTELWCKENMDIVVDKYPDVHDEYAMMDCLVTWGLHEALKGMLARVCELLEIETLPLSETCGKNIENILLALIKKHFGVIDGKDSEFDSNDLKDVINLGRSESLAEIDGNQYGIVPSSVVGGLLFSRTAKYPIIDGWLFDLDLKSCYATALTSMNLYLGQPIHLTFKYEKPTIKHVVELIEKHNIPQDAWQIQATGMLKKATNTLVLSSSQFKTDKDIQNDYKRYAMPKDVDLESETINLIDAEKVSEPTSLSKIATKEINGGKFTKATLTALSDLPDEYYQEFLNLKVDAIIYYEPSIMCYSIDELKEKKEKLKGINTLKEWLTDDLQKGTITQISPNNTSLVFPIAKYYKTVADLRGKMKKSGQPVQEIFKLILNSTYGILASMVMKVNNPITANWITSCARSAAWRMTNACNGFNPITDGTAINSKNIPFGMTFHQVLEKYPDYLENYQPNITNDVELNFKSEGEFNSLYIEHLEKFIGKSDWLTQMYAYDLKDEGDKKDYHYNKHYNTNAGNYLKLGGWGEKLKCRSYRATKELQAWFKECCESEYTRHLIYADKSIIKLSQGSIDAMRILRDADNVYSKNKKEIRMTEELAEKIFDAGLCHPMGFSRYEVKVMKLISTSQFLPKDFKQAILLNGLYEDCKNISKHLLPYDNWASKLAIKMIEKEFPIITSDGKLIQIEYRPELDYEKYNRMNPVGLGFELLIWGNRNFKTIDDVRNRIAQLISEYNPDEQWNIKKNLHWERIQENLENNIYLRHFLAAVQIAKLNYEMDYRETLANSVNDPMARVQLLVDITTLKYEKTRL